MKANLSAKLTIEANTMIDMAKKGELRVACDESGTMTAKKYWPFPIYGDLLFGVK